MQSRRRVSERQLQHLDDDTRRERLRRRPPPLKKIVILIPGIRTNGDWIDDAGRHVEVFNTPVLVLKAYGGRISSWHLFTRTCLHSIRFEIMTQIMRIIDQYPGYDISLICHSMGTDLIADIIGELGYKFRYVIFLGSVCHTTKARFIARNCRFFINHRGTLDIWPIIASIARPLRYSATGTFGFNSGAFVNDIVFNTDHFTCTRNEHVSMFALSRIMETPRVYEENV